MSVTAASKSSARDFDFWVGTAFSADGGEAWEVNWTVEHRRVA